MNDAVPVVWLCGAPGSGKSTVAWRLFHALADQQINVGYVDIDQLGMVHPPPEWDPGRHQAKADALAAVMPNYADAGAQVLIVSGVVDPVTTAPFAHDHRSVVFCHLRATEETLRARLTQRVPGPEPTTAAVSMLSMHRGLDHASFITHSIDTDGRTPDDIAREVRPLAEPQPASPRSARTRADDGEGHLTVVCGPRAVGKSSVSWEMFMRACDRDIPTGYADLEQLGFLRLAEGTNHGLRLSNLAALWNTFRPLGVRSLIANGRVDVEDGRRIRALFPTLTVRIVRLSAGPHAYRQRILQRHHRAPAILAGDDLDHAPPEHQERILREALAEEARHRTADPADEVVDTARLSVGEAADLISRRAVP